MMAKLKILAFIVILSSCNTNNSNQKTDNRCNTPHIKPVYYTEGSNCGIIGYNHTLMLDAYNDSCFNDYNFILIADTYLDTVKSHLPIREITFVKPFDFKPEYDSGDKIPIDEHSIIDIWYTDQSMKTKIPEISSISVWTNEVRKDFDMDNMTVFSRQQVMDTLKKEKIKTANK